MSCGFAGNADIYGIGIRIGYYSQTIAVWFSNYFLYREAKSLRAVNNLFLLALMVAATIYFVNACTTYVVEAFLMLQIGLVIGLVGITEVSRFSSKYIKTSKERLILRMIIIMAGGLFNVCFWWKGLYVMRPTTCNDAPAPQDSPSLQIQDQRHGTYIFYVIQANIYGWAGILMKIKSLAAIVWTAPKIITFDAVVLCYDFRMRKTRSAFIKAVESSSSPFKASLGNINPQWGQSLALQPSPQSRPVASVSRPLVPLLPDGSSDQNCVAQPSEQNTKNTTEFRIKDANTDTELLKSIDNAKKYMEHLFSIYPTITAAMGKKRLVRLCGGCIQFYRPYHKSHCTDQSVSFTQCCYTWLKSNFNNKPPFDLRWRLAVHMTASGQHPPWRWPRLVHRMYTLGEASPPPDWRHVAIASDIILTQVPLVIKTRTWMLMAAYQFAFIVILIIQVELTIAWNHVTGLQSLSTLGQLIPFILGVGGLIKVLWGKWRLVSEGVEEKSMQGGEYEEAIARFLESRETSVERSIVRAATA